MKKTKQLPYPVIALRCFDWAGTETQCEVDDPVDLMYAWVVGQKVRETPKLYEIAMTVFDDCGCGVHKRYTMSISKASVIKKIVLSPGGAKKRGRK